MVQMVKKQPVNAVDMAHKQKVHEEVLKDEEIRAQKQKELEDFLNSW